MEAEFAWVWGDGFVGVEGALEFSADRADEGGVSGQEPGGGDEQDCQQGKTDEGWGHGVVVGCCFGGNGVSLFDWGYILSTIRMGVTDLARSMLDMASSSSGLWEIL